MIPDGDQKHIPGTAISTGSGAAEAAETAKPAMEENSQPYQAAPRGRRRSIKLDLGERLEIAQQSLFDLQSAGVEMSITQRGDDLHIIIYGARVEGGDLRLKEAP